MQTSIRYFASAALVFLTGLSSQVLAAQTPLRPDQVAFRELYKELVETNTTLSSGSCTLAAERMAARLKAAGLPDNQITLFAHHDHPKEGGLVAVYPGTSKTLNPKALMAKGSLLASHGLLDCVGYYDGRAPRGPQPNCS